MTSINDLLIRFDIPLDNIPLSVLDFEIDDNINCFTKGKLEKRILEFNGEFEKELINTKEPAEIRLTIDLRRLKNMDIINSFYNNELVESEENLEQFNYIKDLLFEPRIKYSLVIKDHFTSYEEYNIFGGLLKHS